MTERNRMLMARERAGFESPAEAADRIGCSRPLVNAWEKDESDPGKSKFVYETAVAYKVRPEWIKDPTKPDGFPWHPDGATPAVADEPTESLDTRIRALDTVVTGLARVLAATIPTLGRALEDEVAGLPDDLLGQRFAAVLLKTIQQQNTENDLARPAPKAKKRNRS